MKKIMKILFLRNVVIYIINIGLLEMIEEKFILIEIKNYIK